MHNRPLTAVARVTAAGLRVGAGMLGLVVALLAGLGWLYVLRGWGWLAIGPRVRDSLPLLQLAGFDVQPLGRVTVVWLAAGMVGGAALLPRPRVWRGLLASTVALAALTVDSQAAFALTRNLRFSNVLWSRLPGAGALLGAALFGVGAAVIGQLPRGWSARVGRRSATGASGGDLGVPRR